MSHKILAIRHIPGSTVQVTLYSSEKGNLFYYVMIDGEFFDGDWCDLAEGIDALANPFGVSPVKTSAMGYDEVDSDFEHCYSRT